MKKLIINKTVHQVASPQELAIYTISQLAGFYNELPPATPVKKFVDKSTGAKRLFAILPEYEEVATAKSPSVKNTLRTLYSTAATYTLEQLLEATGTTYKILHDEISRLKNPKYAGKTGTLMIVRNSDGLYGVSI